MNEYLENLNNQNETFHIQKEELRKYAVEHKVPIIKRDSLVLMTAILRQRKIKRILEIGTAIGYSAICLATELPGVVIDTIERNEEMIKIAKKNIQDFNLENRINLICGDALIIDEKNFPKYDMIFIDAAKAQYQKFFERFEKYLNEDGIIFTDNIIFHNLVEEKEENLSKNLKSLVKKIDNYNHYLNERKDYLTYYLESGDGLAMSYKKHE